MDQHINEKKPRKFGSLDNRRKRLTGEGVPFDCGVIEDETASAEQSDRSVRRRRRDSAQG